MVTRQEISPDGTKRFQDISMNKPGDLAWPDGRRTALHDGLIARGCCALGYRGAFSGAALPRTQVLEKPQRAVAVDQKWPPIPDEA